MKQTPDQLVQVARDNWNTMHGADPEVLESIGYDTPDSLPRTLERVLGGETMLAMVTDIRAAVADDLASVEQDTPAKNVTISRVSKTPIVSRPRTRREWAARDKGSVPEHELPPRP